MRAVGNGPPEKGKTMKTRTKIVLGTLLAGVLATGTFAAIADADPDRGGWHGAGFGHGRMGMMGGPGVLLFEQVDADKDGKVTRAELEAFRADRLKRFDRDGNGQLSMTEFEGLWAELTRPMTVRAYQFLDADGNGQVTTDELARPSDRMFARMDRDGDGAVVQGEGRDQRGRDGDRRRDDD